MCDFTNERRERLTKKHGVDTSIIFELNGGVSDAYVRWHIAQRKHVKDDGGVMMSDAYPSDVVHHLD